MDDVGQNWCAHPEENSEKHENKVDFLDFSFFPIERDESGMGLMDHFSSRIWSYQNTSMNGTNGISCPSNQTTCLDSLNSASSRSDSLDLSSSSYDSPDLSPSSFESFHSSLSRFGNIDSSSSSPRNFHSSSNFDILASPMSKACNNQSQHGASICQPKIRQFQEEKWNVNYKELLEFVKDKGHAAVPHTYPQNPQLARWVKRQRCQYKLWHDGKPSRLNAERLDLLNSVGFIWDSHEVSWREKFDALELFHKINGHCNVPYDYEDKKLALWVKYQRRQYKLFWTGKSSAMNLERMQALEAIRFEWELRKS